MPTKNTKREKTRKMEAWAVITTVAKDYFWQIPLVGNGKQWQYPIFLTRRDALAYSRESHGFVQSKIIPCEIVYSLPLPPKRKGK